MEALCIVLRILSYSCRFSDIIPRFGRPVPVLSIVNNQVLDYIYDTQGSALDNCFGFVDGTACPICRFAEHQKAVYNGHERLHALKSQCLALPNGLTGHLYGPECTKWLHQLLLLFFSF